jgi:hypothetical protein
VSAEARNIFVIISMLNDSRGKLSLVIIVVSLATDVDGLFGLQRSR